MTFSSNSSEVRHAMTEVRGVSDEDGARARLADSVPQRYHLAPPPSGGAGGAGAEGQARRNLGLIADKLFRPRKKGLRN